MWFAPIISSYFSLLFERKERLFYNYLFSIQVQLLLFYIRDNFHVSLRFLWCVFYWYLRILLSKIWFYLRIHLVFISIEIFTELIQYSRFKFFANSIFFPKFHGSNCQLLNAVFVKLFPFTAPTDQVFATNFNCVYLFLLLYFHDLTSPFRIFYFSL